MWILAIAVIGALAMPASHDTHADSLIPRGLVETMNRGLALGGTPSRVNSLTLEKKMSGDGTIAYLQGAVQMQCRGKTRVVDSAQTYFVLPSLPEASPKAVDALVSDGYRPMLLEEVATLFATRDSSLVPGKVKLVQVLLRNALDLCLTPAHNADYMALSFWLNEEEDVISVTLKTITRVTFERLKQ